MSTATLSSRRHPAQQRSTSTLSQRSGSSATPLPLRSTRREASPAPSALAQIPSAETVFNSAPRNSSSFTPSRLSAGPIVTDAWMKPFQDVCAIEITPRRTVTSPHLIVTSQLSMSAYRSHNTPISAPSSAHVGGSSPAPSLYRDPTRRTPRQETVMFGVDFEDAARKRQAVYLAEEGNTMKRAAEANAMKSYIVAPSARTQGCSSTAPSSITGSGSVCASSVTFLDILKQKKDKERRTTTTTGSAATTATATTTTLQNSNTTTTPMLIDSQSHRAALEESVATPKIGAVKASSLLSQYLSVANSVGGSSTAKAVASTSPALEEPQAISSSSSDGSDKSKESSLVDKINTSEESPTNNGYDETQKSAHADPSQIELQREDERLPEALLEEELDVPTSWGTPPPPPLVSNPRAALSHVDHGADLNAELLQFTHSRLGLTTATGTSRGASLQSSNTLQAQILQSFGTFLSANWANAKANQLDPKTHALLHIFIGSSEDTTTELNHLERDVRDAVIDAAIEYYVLETITDVLNNNAASEEFEEGE